MSQEYLDISKYPFIDDAKFFVSRRGFTLEDLGGLELAPMVKSAVKRVEQEVGGEVWNEYSGDAQKEVFEFLACAILLKLANYPAAVNKFAMQESRRAEVFIREELVDRKRRGSAISLIYRKLLNLDVRPKEDSPYSLFQVRLTDYLKSVSGMRDPHWSLVNRLVDSGWVYLDPSEAARLARDSIASLIRNRIMTMQLDVKHVPQSVVLAAEELAVNFANTNVTGYREIITVTEFPPCIKFAIKELADGKNLSHQGRTMLASYMVAIGKGTDEIVEYYRPAPDFSEKITRYHIEHLAGRGVYSQKYNVPSCDRLAVGGLCYRNESCGNIRHPLQYGRTKIE